MGIPYELFDELSLLPKLRSIGLMFFPSDLLFGSIAFIKYIIQSNGTAPKIQ